MSKQKPLSGLFLLLQLLFNQPAKQFAIAGYAALLVVQVNALRFNLSNQFVDLFLEACRVVDVLGCHLFRTLLQQLGFHKVALGTRSMEIAKHLVAVLKRRECQPHKMPSALSVVSGEPYWIVVRFSVFWIFKTQPTAWGQEYFGAGIYGSAIHFCNVLFVYCVHVILSCIRNLAGGAELQFADVNGVGHVFVVPHYVVNNLQNRDGVAVNCLNLRAVLQCCYVHFVSPCFVL